MAREEPLCALQILSPKESITALEKPWPSLATDVIANLIAKNCGNGRDWIPAAIKRVSPGKKKPINRPVSAKIIMAKATSPPVCKM